MKCPVDKRNLGFRPGLAAFKSFCKTCQLWYIWDEGKENPRNEKPKTCPRRCDCGRCRR